MNAQRQELINERNDHIDVIAQGAHDLHILAKNLGSQVGDNMKIVDDTNEMTNKHQKKMTGAMGKLSELLRTSDNKQLYTVLV